MTKVELVAAVAEKAELSKKDAEKAVNATLQDVYKRQIIIWKSSGRMASALTSMRSLKRQIKRRSLKSEVRF